MIYLYIILVLIFLYLVYFNIIGNKNVKKFGEARYFLKYIILPLQVEYPNHKKIIENKGRLKYAFYDDLFELTFDFIYLPNKIQVTIQQKTHLKSEKRTATCVYDIDEIRNCCNQLVDKIVIGY